jgi:DNA-binding CsgD family transcriptional regulator
MTGRCSREWFDATPKPKAPRSQAESLGLTPREAEVLALVAEGRTNRQIGQTLFITEKNASLHVSHILAKLGVVGRGQAAAIAHRLRSTQAMISLGRVGRRWCRRGRGGGPIRGDESARATSSRL